MFKKIINYYNNLTSTLQIDYNYDLSQNNFNLIRKTIITTFRIKQYSTDLCLMNHFFKYGKCYNFKSDNSEYIFQKIICNVNIVKWTYWIQFEKILIIDNKDYRADLYMIIKTKNNNFIELIIETDEKHHYSNNNDTINRDYNKNIYAIKRGMALIRIDLSDSKIITQDIINLIIKYITNIHYTNNPIYYFSDKFINLHNNYDKIIINVNPIDINDNDFIKDFKLDTKLKNNVNLVNPHQISFGSKSKKKINIHQ